MKNNLRINTSKSMKTSIKKRYVGISLGTMVLTFVSTVFFYNVWPNFVPYDNVLVDILMFCPAIIALIVLVYGSMKCWDEDDLICECGHNLGKLSLIPKPDSKDVEKWDGCPKCGRPLL